MISYKGGSFQKIASQGGETRNVLKSRNHQDSDKSANRQKEYTEIMMQGVAPQNRHVTSVAQEFLSVHWDRRKPLLLGYSGGPDSKALLYALLECNVTPHLVHVDHGWREESRKETLELQEEARKLGCPFFSTRLENARKEDEAREGRYAFYVREGVVARVADSVGPREQALEIGFHVGHVALEDEERRRVRDGLVAQVVADADGGHASRVLVHLQAHPALV